MMGIGARIKARRVQLGLSQNELAKKLRYDRTSISKIESEGVDLPQSKIWEFAVALNCSLEYLLDLDGKEPADQKLNDGLADENIKLFNSLPDEKKQEALKYMRYLISLKDMTE